MLTPSPSRPHLPRGVGFTLVELLVSISILTLILVMLLSLVGRVSNLWSLSSSKIDAFQGARLAFDLLTRNLSQATLNTYLGYDSETAPQRYLRKSELKFVCGPAGKNGLPGVPDSGEAIFFVAPASRTEDVSHYGGMESLLNTCGYYIDFAKNGSIPNHVGNASNPYRYRLMQRLVPTEKNAIYSGTGNAWFADFASDSRVAADNIIALLIRPWDPAATPSDLSEDYAYDSTLDAAADPQPVTANQLPPVLQVTVVAIDEASAKRLDDGSNPPAAIVAALRDRFTETGQYDANLGDLRKALSDAKIQYRVFSSAVPIREARWTK